jgi:glycosyltransferase involved in cell wall biosynthesis
MSSGRPGVGVIKILRPTKRAELVSARVFDEQFARNLGAELPVTSPSLTSWLDSILGSAATPGSLNDVAGQFAAATSGFDFLCPDHHAIPLIPLFLHLRNRARAPIRLLFIAHAPGAYGLEWALIRPLLAPGDRIIAPSRSAREVIRFLCPDLDAFVRIIPHPIAALPPTDSLSAPRIVSLGRLHRTKLLHRQIEAFALLGRSGRRLPKLQIAGPLNDPDSTSPSAYARSLAAKIDRLGLADHIELVGTIEGDAAKAAFFSNALLSLNLSVSIEESFGKSVVEALGAGVPVLATHWDGLPEAIGAGGGDCIDVLDVRVGMDVDPDHLADRIGRLLDQRPSAEACREQACRSDPARISQRFQAVLSEALAAPAFVTNVVDPASDLTLAASPSSGLLARTAPLSEFSWPELFSLHLDHVVQIRRAIAGEPLTKVAAGEQLRSILIHGLRTPLERLLAGLDVAEAAGRTGPVRGSQATGSGFLNRVGAGAAGGGTRSSRLACLDLVCGAEQTPLLQAGLATMRADGLTAPGIDYLAIEVERQRGDFSRAFQLCVGQEDPDLWGEFAAPRLRQLARVSRELGLPELALPWLREWLETFPDSPDSGVVWADRGLNAMRTSPELADEARASLASARRLLGGSPELDQLDAELGELVDAAVAVSP